MRRIEVDWDKLILSMVIAIAAFTLFAVLLAPLDDRVMCERRQREAVQHGAATWTVDADGERVFRWNEGEARDGE